MTEKQKLFCDEYLIDLNATRAYKTVYKTCKKDKTAGVNATRLLGNASVKEYIRKRMEDRAKRTEVTQDMVLKELASIAFSKASDYAKLKKMSRDVPIYNDFGDITEYKKEEYIGIEFTPTDELTDEQKRALSGIKEGKFGLQVDSCDKVKALELIGKHLGMFKETNMNVNMSYEDYINKVADDDEY